MLVMMLLNENKTESHNYSKEVRITEEEDQDEMVIGHDPKRIGLNATHMDIF